MKKLVMISLFLLIVLVLTSVISASFEIGNLSHSIDKQYGPLDYIRGWINISLDNEPANSVFEDSKGNSISLIDLLKKNTDFDYSCIPVNCESGYSASNGESTKSFNLGIGESKIIGFKFNEDITIINSVNFSVESTATQACYNQLEIDVFNDGTTEFGNNKTTYGDCSFLKSYGCFNESKNVNEYSIGNYPSKHCQRIKLSESPGFKLGAWVKSNGDTRTLTMTLYNLYGEEIEGANCELPANTGEQEIYCDITYLVTESKDYYVCIYSDEYGSSAIKGYSDTANGCGFYGTGIQSENAAFKIFAEGKKFADVGTLNINNSLLYGNSLGEEIQDYIIETYGSLDCSSGCVVPIKFDSKKEQEVTIKDLEIKYDTNLGPTTETNFYDLSENPAIVNADFQELYLNEGNFSVPLDKEDFDFELTLDGKDVISENVSIGNVPIIESLTPTRTASAFPTQFKVIVNSSRNITKYEWNFGNNDTKTTTTNKITYTYNSTGNYELKITITDSSQLSSYKIFNVLVVSPEEIINTTIKKMQEDLSNIKSQIKDFPLFYQESLDLILNTSETEDELKQIQRDFNSASSEEDYNKIMTDLLNLEIPESIIISKSADSIPFYPDEDKINLDILKTIGGGDYNLSDEDKYLNSIIAWNQENLETKVTFKEISARYESYDEKAILRIFKLKIGEQGSLSETPYLILTKLDNLRFDKNYLEKEESGYVYISLEETGKTIIFSTTEKIDFIDLPVFISPEIDRLVISKEPTPPEENGKWALLILILFFLLIIGIIGYIILQEWYKRQYENHLFKNRNNLYNLLSYIGGSKRKGLKDKEIVSKLRKSGWGSEQIDYAMKKYSGKKTGMAEIPVKKILDKFNKKDIKKIPYGRNLGRGNLGQRRI